MYVKFNIKTGVRPKIVLPGASPLGPPPGALKTPPVKRFVATRSQCGINPHIFGAIQIVAPTLNYLRTPL